MPDDLSPDELDPIEKALLYTLGELMSLVGQGYVGIDPGAPYLTAKGLDLFRRLKLTGYEPTTEEIGYAVALYRGGVPADGLDAP